MRASHSLREGRFPLLVTAWLYLRRELLFLAWALMDIALLTPLYFAFMPWARFWSPPLFALTLLALMLTPFNLSRLMALQQVPARQQQNRLLVGALLAALLSLRLVLYPDYGLFALGWLGELFRHLVDGRNPLWGRDVVLFFIVLFTWARGVGMAGRELSLDSLGLRLRLGGLVAAPIVAGIAGSQLPWDVTPFLLLYFFAALLSIALGRAEQIELERSGRSFPMSPRWVGVIVIASLAMVLAAGLVVGLISGQSVLAVIGWLAPLWTAVDFAFAGFSNVLGYLATPLLLAFEWFLQVLVTWLSTRLRALPALETPPEENGVSALSQLIRELTAAAQEQGTLTRLPFVILTVVIVAIAILSLQRLYQRRRGFADWTGAARPGAAGGRAGGRQQGLAGRLRQQLGWLGRWRTAVTIRRIYQQMSQAAAAYGYGRQPAETPFEYQATLDRAWPDHAEATRLITRAYVRIRYGEVPESPAELAAIQAAWQQLEAAPPQSAAA